MEWDGSGGHELSGCFAALQIALATAQGVFIRPTPILGIPPVVMDDYNQLELCLTGPISQTSESCTRSDIDQNGSVDLADFAILQGAF